MSLPDKLYERLTPLERLRAVTSAVARGDLAERDKLVDTCEKKTYKAADHQFTGREDALDLIVLAHYGDVHKKALLGMAALAVVIGLESLLPDTDELTAEQERAWENYSLSITKLADVAAKVIGAERAFDRFCEALGLDADEVRKGHHATRVHVVSADEILSGPFEMVTLTKPDPNAVLAAERENYNLYCEIWSQRFRDTPVDRGSSPAPAPVERLSTGPRTASGKERAAHNADKDGERFCGRWRGSCENMR